MTLTCRSAVVGDGDEVVTRRGAVGGPRDEHRARDLADCERETKAWVTPDPPQRASGRVVGNRRRDRDEGRSRDIHRVPARAHRHFIAGGLGFRVAGESPGPGSPADRAAGGQPGRQRRTSRRRRRESRDQHCDPGRLRGHGGSQHGPAIPPEALGWLFQSFMPLDGRRVHRDNAHSLSFLSSAPLPPPGAAITARQARRRPVHRCHVPRDAGRAATGCLGRHGEPGWRRGQCRPRSGR
jgi:hypothetical protein